MDAVSTNNGNLEELINQNKINIIGTYFGGCGYSVVTKRKILEEIKNTLIQNYFMDESKLNIKTVDLKASMHESFSIPDLNFDKNEFNIFLFYKNKIILIGTSSINYNENYYDYLGGVIGTDKKAFLNNICQKIQKIIEQIEIE